VDPGRGTSKKQGIQEHDHQNKEVLPSRLKQGLRFPAYHSFPLISENIARRVIMARAANLAVAALVCSVVLVMQQQPASVELAFAHGGAADYMGREPAKP
jgi:hypothetical protein